MSRTWGPSTLYFGQKRLIAFSAWEVAAPLHWSSRRPRFDLVTLLALLVDRELASRCPRFDLVALLALLAGRHAKETL